MPQVEVLALEPPHARPSPARRVVRTARRAAIKAQSAIARSPLLSRVYLNCVSAVSRSLPIAMARHVEAAVCHPDIPWPSLEFAPRTAMLGETVRIKLSPHLGEFDQAVLFHEQIDYEQAVFNWLEREAPGRYDAVIEIGANVGVYSVFLDALIDRKPGRLTEVIAFEPSLEAYGRLIGNLRANNARHVNAFRSAVAEAGGFLEFFEPQGHLTNGSLVKRFSGMFSDRIRTSVVAAHGAAEMECFFARYRRVLLKIDVEGYEPDLLAGLAPLIRIYRPDLLIEVLPETADRIEATPALTGYQRRLVTEQGLVRYDRLAASPIHRDWLLTKDAPA